MRGAVQEVFKPRTQRVLPVETESSRMVRRALAAGNGRSNLALRSELEERLVADGIAFDRDVLEKTPRTMFRDGRLRQDADDRFYVADDGPVTIKGKPAPPPLVSEIESHRGWTPWV